MSVYHGGDVWQGGAPGEYLDFSANLNPEGPPQWVRAAMLRGLENARFYPDLRQGAAVAGLSAHLGLPEDCILPTAGGIEAIACAAKQFSIHAVAQPTFQEYGRLCGAHRDIGREALSEYRFSGGENLYPVQIEDFLNAHPSVKDVAVIGLPDARLGEIAAAIVEIKEGVTCTEEEINAFCLGMPRYKRPRKVIFDKVPRNPTGKIEKPVLREKYCKGRLVEAQITG